MSTLVFDLDGTLCEQTAGGEGYFSAEPIQPMIDILNKEKSNGKSIIIYTARGMNLYNWNVTRIELEYRTKTEAWLRDHGVKYDVLVFGKPPGDLYIDDKGMHVESFLKIHDVSYSK